MSAAGPSNYTFLEISKPSRGTSVRLEGKILGFNYFESVYSPMITASITGSKNFKSTFFITLP